MLIYAFVAVLVLFFFFFFSFFLFFFFSFLLTHDFVVVDNVQRRELVNVTGIALYKSYYYYY